MPANRIAKEQLNECDYRESAFFGGHIRIAAKEDHGMLLTCWLLYSLSYDG